MRLSELVGQGGESEGMSRRFPLASGLDRGELVEIFLDERPIEAYDGETLAAVFLARGEIATRRTKSGKVRGIFCGIGGCFDCLVVVDDVPNTRACVTAVRAGMRVSHQAGLGGPPRH